MSLALSVMPAVPACNEHELVAAVRRGDERAFEELYSRYRARIGSYVFGMIADHQRAEDIAQEVFISALRRLRDTERPIAFKPWIYEIAKNACIDEFRRARRAREVPLQDDEDDGGQRPLVSHGLDAAIENKQRLENLWRAFHGLSESHHRLIVMRELEGRSYSQIGERMGMTRPAVESTLFRARRRLSEEYDELVSGRRCEQVQTVIAAERGRPLRKLGIRDRRRLARHLAHCEPCRRYARMAGADDAFFHIPGLAAKIAALLPFPCLRWRRSRGSEQAMSAASSHTVSALQSLPSMAPLVDPGGPAAGLGRAAATAAAIVAAGAGGGLVSGLNQHSGNMPRPAAKVATAAHSAAGTRQTQNRQHGARASSASSSFSTGSGGSLASRRAHPGSASVGASRLNSRGSQINPGSGAGGGTGSGSGSNPGAGGSGAHGRADAALHQPVSAPKGITSKVPVVGGASSASDAGSTPAKPQLKPPTATTRHLPSLPKPQLPTRSLPKAPTLPNVSLPDPRRPLPPGLGGQNNSH